MLGNLGRIIGMCLLLYLLVMALAYTNANKIQLPSLPGTHPVIIQPVGG